MSADKQPRTRPARADDQLIANAEAVGIDLSIEDALASVAAIAHSINYTLVMKPATDFASRDAAVYLASAAETLARLAEIRLRDGITETDTRKRRKKQELYIVAK